MVRAPCCEKMGLKRGPWTPQEDQILISFILNHGHGNWRALPKQAGLLRCGKSCRLRWMNYLRPDIKRGNFTKEEEETIIKLHQMLGNRWSVIAAKLPGRTDNEIKNVWHTHLKKRLKDSDSNEPNLKTNLQYRTESKPKPSHGSTVQEPENLRDDGSGSSIVTEEHTGIYPVEDFGTVIDESFWSDALSEYNQQEHNVTTSAESNFPAISSEDLQQEIQMGFENWVERFNNGMDFWDDFLSITGEQEQELPQSFGI